MTTTYNVSEIGEHETLQLVCRILDRDSEWAHEDFSPTPIREDLSKFPWKHNRSARFPRRRLACQANQIMDMFNCEYIFHDNVIDLKFNKDEYIAHVPCLFDSGEFEMVKVQTFPANGGVTVSYFKTHFWKIIWTSLKKFVFFNLFVVIFNFVTRNTQISRAFIFFTAHVRSRHQETFVIQSC